MSLVINTNVASLNVQRNLLNSSNAMQTAMQRLSSGLRINSAKDDAAGLAISDRMTSQVNGLDQAVRNANDGISLAQTGEGALDEATNILQRIREIAVQSGNDSNTADDRQKMQDEVTSLTSELDRIATSTQYNGKALFDGTFGTANFQVGANAGQTISTSIANFRTAQYGDNQMQGTASAGAAATRTVAGSDIVVNGSISSGTYTTVAGDTAKTIAEGINALGTGVTASAKTQVDATFSAAGNYNLTVQSDNSSAVTISFAIGGTSGSDNLAAAVQAFNNVTGKTGVTAQVNSAGDGITLTNAQGNDITLGNAAASAGTVTAGGQAVAAGGSGVINGQVTLDSESAFSATDAGSGYGIAAASSTLKSVASLDVTSATNASLAIKIADGAIAAIDKQRSQFGALQNRFTSTISNLQSVSQNLSAARSRIKDADFAQETSNLSKAQVLQQAGTAMLAQANASTQSVLTLLRG